MNDADRCSRQWDDPDLPAWGSAAPATFWVALEQDGPWGDPAIVSSRLDPSVGADLEGRCFHAGGRLLLIRRPGRHLPSRRRTVLVAGNLAGDPWLVEGTITSPAQLLELPFADLATSGPDAVIAALSGRLSAPVVLVCTNGKRDVCCAVFGRPVAADAAAARPGRVWECSHTGGHRFAPTCVVLPSGQTLARLTSADVVAALDAADVGRLVAGPRHDRGRSHLDPVAQAAEAWVRDRTGLLGLHDVLTGQPRADGPGVVVPVTTTHREWTLRVERVALGGARRDACAKSPVPSTGWQVTECPPAAAPPLP